MAGDDEEMCERKQINKADKTGEEPSKADARGKETNLNEEVLSKKNNDVAGVETGEDHSDHSELIVKVSLNHFHSLQLIPFASTSLPVTRPNCESQGRKWAPFKHSMSKMEM
jgi:hypothetical protein